MKAIISIDGTGLRIDNGHSHELFVKELQKIKKESYCAEHFVDMATQYVLGICQREHAFWEISESDLKTKLMEVYRK